MRGFDVETLYEAMVKNATTSKGRPRDKKGKVVSAVGREGVEYYNRLGYVPYDVGINENAARTLEYATADFSLSRVAAALGKTEDAKLYAGRAQNYRKLYDPQSGWMRGRNKDGSWSTPFNPYKWGDAFTEGNAVHYSWSVMQDVQGLIDLMGGDTAFIDRLDSVFTTPPIFDDSYYGTGHPRDPRDADRRHGPVRAWQPADPAHDLSLRLGGPAVEDAISRPRRDEEALFGRRRTAIRATRITARPRPGTCSPRSASIR